jgi:hypothetical protein
LSFTSDSGLRSRESVDDLNVDQSESLEERLAQIEERLSKLEGKANV